MKAHSYNFNMVTLLIFSIFFGLSCSNDTDLLVDSLLSNIQGNERIIGDDYFVVQPNESSILNVLSNDGFSQDANVQIIEISSPTYGSAQLAEDNISILYTPQSESNELPSEETTEATTDTFTYTIEFVNENQTNSIEVGIVKVVIDSGDEEPNTGVQDDNNDPNNGDSNEEEEGEDTTLADDGLQSAKLLFSSGFEGIDLGTPNEGYQYLSGTDEQTGFSWPMRILGSDFSGIHRVNDGGGGAIENKIEAIQGPNGHLTSALFQQVNYDVQVTQTPFQINNIKENPEELYMSYWMKTDDTAVKGIDKWRAIWEYKTDNYASYENGFRMIAFMATDYEGKPYWLFQGDTSPQDPIWQVENYDIPLILNEWFKVEYYIKWSDGVDGYASMKVNGQLIGEHYGATTSNSDNMDFIMLTQVYGNSHPMHQWVDDIEIWDGLPESE